MLKHIHMASALISIGLFFLRGVWLLMNSRMMQQKWVKIIPHVNDSLLLLTAIILAWQIGQAPFADHWLTAKVVGLLVYIALGMAAFRFAANRATRSVLWLAAIFTFFYIVSVARTRDPMGFLVML